ncbi:MAG: hypothetical protein WC080_00830 [Patescibacteria group bacterium]|jgi:thiamine kinase-like enzyme
MRDGINSSSHEEPIEGLSWKEKIESGDELNKLWQQVLECLKSRGVQEVRPVRFYGVHENIDLNLEGDEAVLNYIRENKVTRPFWIFEGAHPEHKIVITKMRLSGEDPRGEARNERIFYEDIASDIEEEIPENIRGRVNIPKYLASESEENGNGFVQYEYAEGEPMSHVWFEAADGPMPIEDFKNLVEFIKAMQKAMNPEKIAAEHPEITMNSEGACPTHKRNREMMHEHESEYREWLGDDVFDRMMALLDEKEEFVRNSGAVFTNIDINMSNIIKSDDGSMTIIDWERLKLLDNQAAAFSYIPATHWMYPERQQEMFSEVLEENSENPDFKELFRLALIYYRFARVPMMYYWLRLKNGNLTTTEEIDHAKKGLEANKRLLIEALNNEGVWSNESVNL